jgi:pimeloyl-ACP methyl ester carboxylesterase
MLGIVAWTLSGPKTQAGQQPPNGSQAVEQTQSKEGEGSKAVEFDTVDGVGIKGRFFAGNRGKDSPCVLMLHALGENSNNKEWQNLAKKLQEKGYAVLTFDFRGHGDSTVVLPGIPNRNPQLIVKGFWDEPLNQQGVKGYALNKPRPTEIKYEQFNTGYYTVLINDIAAAKTFLDDADCNSSNLTVIGAKDGATLGSIWLNAEWHRYRLVPAGPGVFKADLDRQNPEGQAVVGAAWLSLSSTLGNAKTAAYNLQAILDWPAKLRQTPMLFVYAKSDEKSGTLAKKLEQGIVGKNVKLYPNTSAFAIDQAEKMSGKDLLVESFPTTTKILDFMDAAATRKVAPKQLNVRSPEDVYYWEPVVNGRALPQGIIAKKSRAKLLEFSNYAYFVR